MAQMAHPCASHAVPCRTLHRKPELAFALVGERSAGQVTPPATLPVAPPVQVFGTLMNARSRLARNEQPEFLNDLPLQLANPFLHSSPQRRKLVKRDGPILRLDHRPDLPPRNRSEERRVGKECRSRWSP